MPEQRPCSMCGKVILWCHNATGHLMPVDPEESPDGKIVLVDGIAHTLNGSLFEPVLSGPRHHSHLTTCPDQIERKKGRKK